LQNRGYGWLRPEGVKAGLKEMGVGSTKQHPPIAQTETGPQQENNAQETIPDTQTGRTDKKLSFWKRLTNKN
jgi:hypothetical protein